MADYAIVIMPLSVEDGGGFAGYVPDLPGCTSDGETYEEALANTQDAIAAWIDMNVEMGRPAPLPGTAAERMRVRDEALFSTLRAVLNYADAADGKISDLELKVETLLRLMQDEVAPRRTVFEAVVSDRRTIARAN
jgi:antitoxin HicB